MAPRHLLSITDLARGEIEALLDLTARMKKGGKALAKVLAGRTVALIFEKQSTRTRLSQEVACAKLGARALTIAGTDLQIGRGETLEDSGRIFSLYVDAVCWRTTGHDRLEQFASAATVPVVNLLSDLEHPCQILADLFTIGENFGKRRPPLAFIGDGGNNMAHSWVLAAARLGMDLRVAYPEDYGPDAKVRERAAREAKATGARLTFTNDPAEAAKGAGILYTDVWVSMGQEEGREARLKRFRGYQVNGPLLALAARDAVVMHCLPAHRGEEISAEVMDGKRSVVFEQARNRLYNAMAVLVWCIKGGKP